VILWQKKSECFFKWCEEVWELFQVTLRYFYIYYFISFGLLGRCELDLKTVVIILATNLGIYQVQEQLGEAFK